MGSRIPCPPLGDGVGGARVGAGSGLRGIVERPGAFDGTGDVESPSGGPTAVRLHVPLDGVSATVHAG
ncbi:hypothetical protein [Rugosimonospora africana]|uniref:hypothetical protein n=1 Tax=Rugosimonospora africana TaxID=556532 RepID=UPI00194489F3|nr:hypothetical protein [Rugosimonospora africana]